ncbi:MAG: hypothetical protein PGMFKBFP_03263 [Anaerolineales bacterium]|nr:hypothetical protein [Anaerolineales bacterium]
MPDSPVKKSLKEVKPLPVTVVDVDELADGLLHTPPLYFCMTRAPVLGEPTRSPAAKVTVRS